MINYRSNRRNRFKSNTDRNFRKRQNNGHKNHNDFNNNNDFRHRNPGRNNQNAAKLVDKYNNLAREALSSGDKILSENYLQHADHFTRVLNERESFRKEKIYESKSENKINSSEQSNEINNDLSNNNLIEDEKKEDKIEEINKTQL